MKRRLAQRARAVVVREAKGKTYIQCTLDLIIRKAASTDRFGCGDEGEREDEEG